MNASPLNNNNNNTVTRIFRAEYVARQCIKSGRMWSGQFVEAVVGQLSKAEAQVWLEYRARKGLDQYSEHGKRPS